MQVERVKQLWKAGRLAPREALAMALERIEELEQQLRELGVLLDAERQATVQRIEELERQLRRHITDQLDYWKQEAQK